MFLDPLNPSLYNISISKCHCEALQACPCENRGSNLIKLEIATPDKSGLAMTFSVGGGFIRPVMPGSINRAPTIK